MATIPAKRLLVYIVSGLIVLAVGSGAVVAMRGDSAKGDAASAAAVVRLTGVTDVASPGVSSSAAAGPTVVPDIQGAVSGTPTTGEACIFVQVAGAVRRPGVYKMRTDARVFHAVEQAGGFAPDADQEAPALAAGLSDGCRVYVPRVGEAAAVDPSPPVSPSASPAAGPSAGEGNTAAGGLLSINTAGVAQLDTLPGIGPALAANIVSYREANGPFTSVDELGEVPGIGPSKLERLRPLVTL